MNKKLDKKGFTLVELLAVLVILIAIMGIAIPSISSSLERTKSKQNEARQKVVLSAAELYITDYKNVVYENLSNNGNASSCYIHVSDLSDYLSEDEMKDSEGDSFKYIIFTKPNKYVYSDTNNEVSLECK